MKKRVVELLLVLFLTVLVVGVFGGRRLSLAHPIDLKPTPSSRPITKSTSIHEPKPIAVVDPKDFLSIRKRLGPPYANARLGNLTPANQAQFETGQLVVPQEGVWVDLMTSLDSELGYAVLIASPDTDGRTRFGLVVANPNETGPVHSTRLGYEAPERFDLELVMDVLWAKS